MTTLPPIQKLSGDRPILQGRWVAPVRQKDGQSGAGAKRRRSRSISSIGARDRFRAVDEAVVGAELCQGM